MKEEELQELERALRAAAPLPWTTTGDDRLPIANVTTRQDNAACGDPECCGSYEEWTTISASDAAAIVAAVNAAPSLISEVRALRARVKELWDRESTRRDAVLAEIARNG
jgi:hypothetical protein